MRRRWMVLRMILCMVVVLIFSTTACGKNQKKQVLLETIETGDMDEKSAEETEGTGADSGTGDKKEGQDQIYVCVCGAVTHAGVYAMPKGSRIYEAIQMAGGFAKEAAVDQINQAEVLEDEDYIYVPTKAEVASGAVADTQAGSGTKSNLVDLNRAGKEELMTIPGIGEAKASQIIGYREEHGKFNKIEDIMNISGIKEGLFEKIKDYIKV